MRLTRTGTRRTRHGGNRRRIFTIRHDRPSWLDSLARQLHREFRGLA